MDHRRFLDWLYLRHACFSALRWLQEGEYDLAQTWEKCDRADWLLWLACEIGCDQKKTVKAALECAKPVIGILGEGDGVEICACVLSAEIVEGWLRGEEDLNDVDAAFINLRGADGDYALFIFRRVLNGIVKPWSAWQVAESVAEAFEPGDSEDFAANGRQCEILATLAEVVKKYIKIEDIQAGVDKLATRVVGSAP